MPRSRTATSAMFAAGSMPSTGTPARAVVLQQVAVVAGDLDDQDSARPGARALDQSVARSPRHVRSIVSENDEK